MSSASDKVAAGWEKVSGSVIRFQVPGGWIYRIQDFLVSGYANGEEHGVNHVNYVFVPDPVRSHSI